MITALIFDCFGVLCSDGLMPFLQRHFGRDPARLREAMDMCKRVDAGLSDYDEYVRAIAAMAGVTERAARQEIEANVPDEQLFAYIKQTLKPRFKLGLLSNAGRNWLHDIFTPDQLALFDATQLSYEAGAVKPDPRAYELMAARLGVEPQECVFIDDLERYTTGARETGMRAIRYTGFRAMKHQLEMILKEQAHGA